MIVFEENIDMMVVNRMQKSQKKQQKKNCKTQSERDFHPLGRYTFFSEAPICQFFE
jgi:hypothetical protein